MFAFALKICSNSERSKTTGVTTKNKRLGPYVYDKRFDCWIAVLNARKLKLICELLFLA